MLEQPYLNSRQKASYQQLLEHLRKKGIRITETRKAVVAYMIATTSHPSAEQIYHALQADFPKMSLATVYNNLKVLVDEGFVTELKISKDKTTHYDYMGHQHLNVVCELCGKIVDVDMDIPNLKLEAQEHTGYQVHKTQMMAYGICPECAQKEPVAL